MKIRKFLVVLLAMSAVVFSCKKDKETEPETPNSPITSCTLASTFATDSITETSVLLTWNGDAKSEIIFNGQTISVVGNSYHLTGLTANTSYSVDLKSKCGNDSIKLNKTFQTPKTSENSIENYTIDDIPEGMQATFCGNSPIEINYAMGGLNTDGTMFEFFASPNDLSTSNISETPWLYLILKPTLGFRDIDASELVTYCKDTYMTNGSTIRGDWWMKTGSINMFECNLTNKTISAILSVTLWDKSGSSSGDCEMVFSMKNITIGSFEKNGKTMYTFK